jgi:hypothetical protein
MEGGGGEESGEGGQDGGGGSTWYNGRTAQPTTTAHCKETIKQQTIRNH